MPGNQLPQATLCYLVKEGQVLLAMKKRGLGENKWNGVGGKLNPGETPTQAMVREAREEIGVTLLDLQPVARLRFYFPADRTGWNQEVHVFLSDNWQGEPTESEEMRPQWFPKDQLPFDQMWQDDKLWLPPVLNGRIIQGKFRFNLKGEVEDYTLHKTSAHE